ncbi:MAG: methyltransferase domain-containing protein [Solirubrobacteraceae bacterium MAG38_C4-C5]|nr:methyltransferase domain-containing protein [Candidatus Siliceabacter maunaloa]
MTTRDELDAFCAAQRALWGSAGDYAAIAPHLEPVADALVERLAPSPGAEVLDVATGTGNAALALARAGVRVTALDLTPALLEQGRCRAAADGVDIDWVEGDAEVLPFAAATFDAVVSVFGVMFAPRHAVACAELVRVCRPGGRIVVAAWTPEGYAGRMASIASRHLPARPRWALAPTSWGDEEHVRRLFAPHPVELGFERRRLDYCFPSVEGFQAFMEHHSAVYVLILHGAREQGREDEARQAMLALAHEHDRGDERGAAIGADYLLITAALQPTERQP